MVLLLLFVIIILLADIFREEMVRLQESCQGKKLGVNALKRSLKVKLISFSPKYLNNLKKALW